MFTINVAADCGNRKVNLQIPFRGGQPSIEELITVITHAFGLMRAVLGDTDYSQKGKFNVAALFVFRESVCKWQRVERSEEAYNGCQMYVLQEGVSEVPDVIGPPKDMAPFLTPFMSQQASFRPAYSTDTQSPVSLAQPWENTRFSRGAPASRGTQRETSRFSFPVPDSGHAAPVKRSSEVVSGLSRNTSLRNVESPTTHKVSRYQTRAAEPSPNPSPRDAPAYSVSPTQSGRIDPAEERRPFTKKEGRHYLDYKPLSSSVSLLTEARLPRPSKSPRVFSDITPKIFQLRNGESVIRDERVHIEHQSQLDLDTLRAELRKEEADMQRSLSR